MLDRRVVSLETIEGRGYTAAYHAVAELEDGLSVFVKAGTEEVTSAFLREEIRFYRAFQAPFMPDFHGADDGDPPILVIEDRRDIAASLPSLRLEGGPEPEEILTGGGGFAAALAGLLGSRVGLPPLPTAPQVCEAQRAQLEVALAWASRELDLRLER
jgi:hypothetical protein